MTPVPEAPVPAALAATVADLHARLDAWASVVAGVGAESESATDALSDPRLEHAADAFHDALGRYEEATLTALGLVVADGVPDDEDEDDDGLVVDDFYVHMVVGVPDGASPARLDSVIDVMDGAATDLVERVQAAGFMVPEWGISRGDPDGEFDEEDE